MLLGGEPQYADPDYAAEFDCDVDQAQVEVDGRAKWLAGCLDRRGSANAAIQEPGLELKSTSVRATAARVCGNPSDEPAPRPVDQSHYRLEPHCALPARRAESVRRAQGRTTTRASSMATSIGTSSIRRARQCRAAGSMRWASASWAGRSCAAQSKCRKPSGQRRRRRRSSGAGIFRRSARRPRSIRTTSITRSARKARTPSRNCWPRCFAGGRRHRSDPRAVMAARRASRLTIRTGGFRLPDCRGHCLTSSWRIRPSI